MQQPAPTSSRILYDIPCKVCQDHSSGKHYGIFACDGCAGFFKRSIRRARQYVCKAKSEGSCLVDKIHRNQCRACRLTKCLQAGMNKDAVQHERGPRNSTLRRQMALYLKDAPGPSLPPPALDLAMHKPPPHGMLLGMPKIPVRLPLPAPLPLPSVEVLCEHAARLLFLNVQWAKTLPAFTALNFKDQLLLLEDTWRELFVLGAAQFQLPLDALAPGVPTALLPELKGFQEALMRFGHLAVDHHEYACLKAIVLFKTALEGDRSLQEPSPVSSLQDHAQLTLSAYVATSQPSQPHRFGKLLLLLPALRTVAPSTITQLFFKRTIGDIPIERIICDMFRAGS